MGYGGDDGLVTRNCNAWSSVESGVGLVGIGIVDGQHSGFDWETTGGNEPCATAEQPLLCMATAPCVD